MIEQTEALVSIDVNTGPKVHGKDQGKIILETNIDACYEIAKQLRLRDVGGLIIIDFMVRKIMRDTIMNSAAGTPLPDTSAITTHK